MGLMVDRKWAREFEHRGLTFRVAFGWAKGDVPTRALIWIEEQPDVSGTYCIPVPGTWKSEEEAVDVSRLYGIKFIDDHWVDD